MVQAALRQKPASGCCFLVERGRSPSKLPLPARPKQQPRDIDDVVVRGSRIVFRPGDIEPNPEVDTPRLLKLDVAIGKIMQHEDTKQQYSKVVRGWNTRYTTSKSSSRHTGSNLWPHANSS